MMMFFRWEIYAALGMPALTFYSLRKLSLDELGMQTLEMGNLTLLWLIGHFCKKALKEDGEPAWDSGLWPVYSVWFPGKRLKVLALIQVSCVAMDSLFWASVLLSIMCCIRVPLRANAVWVWSTNVILEVKVDLYLFSSPSVTLTHICWGPMCRLWWGLRRWMRPFSSSQEGDHQMSYSIYRII